MLSERTQEAPDRRRRALCPLPFWGKRELVMIAFPAVGFTRVFAVGLASLTISVRLHLLGANCDNSPLGNQRCEWRHKPRSIRQPPTYGLISNTTPQPLKHEPPVPPFAVVPYRWPFTRIMWP